MSAMAQLAILGTFALGLLHITSAGRPQSAALPSSERLERNADASSDGVSVRASGAFANVQRRAAVSDHSVEEERQPLTPRAVRPHDGDVPSLLAVKQDVAARLGSPSPSNTQSGEGTPAVTPTSGTPPATGNPTATGNHGTPAENLATGSHGNPGAPPVTEEHEVPYVITEEKYRPAKPTDAELLTKKGLTAYPEPWKDAKGGVLKASNVYDKIRDKLMDQERLVLSKDFDIAGFAEKGHKSFVKNVEYHTALQKYVENLFKMSSGAHAVTEREYNDQDKRAKAIQEELNGENIDLNNGLPPAPAAGSPTGGAAHHNQEPSPASSTPSNPHHVQQAPSPAVSTPSLAVNNPEHTPPATQHTPPATHATTVYFYKHPTYGNLESEDACNSTEKKLSSGNKRACRACVSGGPAKMREDERIKDDDVERCDSRAG